MNPKFNYVVLGAGRQGTAAAYDIAKWGEAKKIILADCDREAARNAAQRVNTLIGKALADPIQINAINLTEVRETLTDADACLSALPYSMNLAITNVALDSGVNFCDLGGSTDIARKQHAFDEAARQADISIIPNCGQVPGMGTTLMVRAIELLDRAIDVYAWDGGLPQNPRPPFDYLMTFNIAGLTNEYDQPAVFIRDGKVTEVPQMTELERVEFPKPIGTLEAFVAGGGTDTMPWTYEGKLRTLQNLTLRYPGHFTQLRAFYDLGLWGLEPIKIGNANIIPREVFHALFLPKVDFPGDKDLVIVRVKAIGEKDGKEAEALVEVIDYYDEDTEFTAMERGTGWSAAIVAEMMARGETPKGAGGVEKMVPAKAFVDELNRHGIKVREEITFV